MQSRRIGVIGAGFSGLYAACVLAKEGHEVEVFEKNSMSGGRSQTFEAEGFLFDMGPSWYWMPDLIDDLFSHLGENREDYYKTERLETAYQVFWKNHSPSKIPADKKKLKELFDGFEENGGQKLEKFLHDAGVKYEVAKPLLEKPGKSLSELMTWDVIKNGLKLDVFKSVEKDVGRRFSSDQARGILNFPVLFLGAMPSDIPSLYTLMNFADLELGTWYPEGGMHAIGKALEAIARKYGVKFHFNKPVEAILEKDGVANGLRANGEDHAFDYVVSGADYHFTEQKLLPKKYRRYDDKYWDSRKMAPSSLLFYVGLDSEVPNLEHHNLFFDEDLTDHGNEIYKTPTWPEKPLFYVCTPSKTDKKVAPEGCENMFILIPIAPDLDDNEETREKYFEIIRARIEQHTGVNIAPHIVYKRSFCVNDFKTEYNSFKGNAYGLANTIKQTANLKPKMHSKLKNLYFCGQLTVPGPGIPPALISGKIAANQILNKS